MLPNLGAIDLNKFQDDVGAWSQHNFGDQPAHRPLLGMVEEAGELVEALDGEQFFDSVGDLMIFMADFCYRSGLSLAEIARTSTDELAICDPSMLLKNLGRVCHAYLKIEQGIRINKDHAGNLKRSLSRVVTLLAKWVRSSNVSLAEVMLSTWAKVSARDWKANPVEGAV